MENLFKLSIYKEVNGVAAVSADDGRAIFEKIKIAMENGKNIVLDFLNIEFLTSAFLNPAVGQLFSIFSPDKVESIQLENISKEDKKLYEDVILKAKTYHTDPEFRKKIIADIKEELKEHENN